MNDIVKRKILTKFLSTQSLFILLQLVCEFLFSKFYDIQVVGINDITGKDLFFWFQSFHLP